MIHFQTPEHGSILGSETLPSKVVKQAIAYGFNFTGCCLLSADEIAMEFKAVAPLDAIVDESVRTLVAKMTATNEALGRRVVLVRWRDGTESFVAFDGGALVPPPQMLQRAYQGGYGARRENDWFAKNPQGCGHA